MSDNQKHEQRRFAIEGIKNTGFYYTKSLVDGKYKLPMISSYQENTLSKGYVAGVSPLLRVLWC